MRPSMFFSAKTIRRVPIGLLLAHLSVVCEQTRPDRPQVWRLATTRKAPDDAWDYMTRAAERPDTTAQALYGRERLGADELGADLLG